MKDEKESSRNNLYVSKGISKIWRLHTDGCRVRVSFLGDHVRYPKQSTQNVDFSSLSIHFKIKCCLEEIGASPTKVVPKFNLL